MRKSLIPFAGIFLACILCAGIPAVAAAENTNPASGPAGTITIAETPQPWYTPVMKMIGMQPQADNAGQQNPAAQANDPLTNAAANSQKEMKNWWESILPSHETTVTAPQASTVQTPVQNYQDPAPAVAQNQGQVHIDSPSTSSTTSTPQNPDKPQNSPEKKGL